MQAVPGRGDNAMRNEKMKAGTSKARKDSNRPAPIVPPEMPYGVELPSRTVGVMALIQVTVRPLVFEDFKWNGFPVGMDD
jgi:hypothetical protein